MNNKFATILAIAIAFTFTNNSSALIIRGSTIITNTRDEEQQHNLPRRHLLEDEYECGLYTKIISWPNRDEVSWSCEFPRAYAKENFGGRDIMGIVGLNKEDIDSRNAVSGESIMKVTGAYVEQFLDSATSASNNDGEDIKLVVTNPAAVIIESITENDVRHHRYHKNRRLSIKRNTGVIKTLVVRPISPNGSVVDESAAQLRSDVFEDDVCLKSQMEACSFNQLEIQPANVGDGGVVDVYIEINPISYDNCANGNRGQLAQSAVAKTDELYGGNDGLAAEFDLVLFCLPRSGTWDAFAYFNRYDSYYNKNRCSTSGVLMHEVG
jgi:hypothetical protein